MEEEGRMNIPVDFFEVQLCLKLGDSRGERSAFHRFSEARVSHVVIRLMGIVFIPVLLYVYITSVLDADQWFYITAIGLSFLLCALLAGVLVYYQDQVKKGLQSEFVKQAKPWMVVVGNLLPVYFSTTIGVFLIVRVIDAHYQHEGTHNYNYGMDTTELPQEHVLILRLLPIVLSTVFKSIQTPYVVTSWLVCIGCMGASIAIARADQSIPTLILYIPISAAILYENHRQNIILFLVLRKQQKLLEENKTLAEASQNELRFMIANMAHDLKTPLSSFMNGVETLSSLFSDLVKSSTAEKTRALHAVISENITNLFNVNSFMTMTVNRCIDYMKASKGIKLEPRLETIHLQEVLSMPLNCMRDLQSRIAIEQAAIPASVCSHIITDLQWFQENLFCLISNAVKYSSHGHITVSVAPVTGLHGSLTRARELRGALPRQNPSTGSDLDALAPGEKYAFLDKMAGGDAGDDGASGSVKTTTGAASVDLRRPSLTREASVRPAPQQVPPSLDSESFLLIEVEDTGIGLSDEVKASLFTPFKQAQRRAGGTGLGLYSLAKRVDALGGYYGVCNRRDGQQGSIFWFAIPYRPDEVAAATAPEKHPVSMRALAAAKFSGFIPAVSRSNSKPSPRSGLSIEPAAVAVAPTKASPKADSPPPLRVLLVDDSVTILMMTTNLLKRHGHVVDKEENGADALTRLEKARAEGIHYDVMLIDLNMPVMDGLEAMKRLREAERSLNAESVEAGGVRIHQRVFAFSANSDRETMREAMEAGADDFICKPFSIQTFQEKCALLRSNSRD